jgi:hypothetical protein
MKPFGAVKLNKFSFRSEKVKRFKNKWFFAIEPIHLAYTSNNFEKWFLINKEPNRNENYFEKDDRHD